MSASQDQISWVLTSYIVASAITMPLTGWLAGRFGIKYIFLASVIGFTFASALCGAATSLTQLVVYRLLQGICSAGLVPLGQATLFTIYPRERHGHAMAIFSTGAMMGPIIGPTLGGWLTDNFDWRWCFYINLPVGALCALGIFAFIRPSRADAARPVRHVRLWHAQHRHRRVATDARPRRDQGLVPLDRNLDRSDDLGLVLLSVGRPHGDRRRALVPQPRTAEKPEFRRRQPVDVRGRHDPQRHPGADALDDAGFDELPGVRRRLDDGAARLRHDARDVHCRPHDQPGRQPPVHPGRVSADRGLVVADDRVFAADGVGTDPVGRVCPGFRAWLHLRPAQPARAVRPAATTS